MNNALKNAKAIRHYVEYLRNAKRRSESTIRAIERAIRSFENATGEADFARFDRHKAKRFTVWLEEEGLSGNGTSARQSYQVLTHLRSFFHWLAFQSGYKSKVQPSDIDYLSLDKIKLQEVNSQQLVDWPSKEHVISLVNSIGQDDEIDRRDRALVSFLLLSGMRDMAVASLPLGCFDPNKLEVQQFPEMGVETKNSKKFVSRLFEFDDHLVAILTIWVEYLKTDRKFSASNPLFPRSRVTRDEMTSEFISREVEPVFWKSAGPIRNILKFRSKNAGLQYYKPHAFRHAASQLALRQCLSPEDIRAVSQNLGHENVGTTLTNYAKLTPERIQYVLGSINFKKTENHQFDEEFMRKLQLFARVREKDIDNHDLR